MLAALSLGSLLDAIRAQSTARPAVESMLETVEIATKKRRLIYQARAHFEAPNWSRDGKYFLFNRGGRIYRLPVAGGEPELVDTGFATRCNNDHGISPDGTQLVISDQSQENRRSLIYILPIAGGTPRRVTQLAPSYWHGWSPDGKTLAYCAERNGEYDIYTIPVEGGDEKRLTTAAGLDDGPDYSHDGKYIYFNSERTGRMQIWRMKTDGSEQQSGADDSANHSDAGQGAITSWAARTRRAYARKAEAESPARSSVARAAGSRRPCRWSRRRTACRWQ